MLKMQIVFLLYWSALTTQIIEQIVNVIIEPTKQDRQVVFHSGYRNRNCLGPKDLTLSIEEFYVCTQIC